MSPEIEPFSDPSKMPAILELTQASSDQQLLEIWLHGRSPHTQRAYRADLQRFRKGAGKPFAAITLSDLQEFADSLAALAPASGWKM